MKPSLQKFIRKIQEDKTRALIASFTLTAYSVLLTLWIFTDLANLGDYLLSFTPFVIGLIIGLYPQSIFILLALLFFITQAQIIVSFFLSPPWLFFSLLVIPIFIGKVLFLSLIGSIIGTWVRSLTSTMKE